MKKLNIVLALLLLLACNVNAQKKKAEKKTAVASEQKNDTATDSLRAIVVKAEKGDAAAQNIVGTWYYNGVHYDKDYDKALKWWTLSAKQQYAKAIGNLGLLYQYGRGVEADSVKALNLYISSIDKGNKVLLQQREAHADKGEDAFNAMLCAVCYQEGKGVGTDLKKAIRYYEIAAKAKSADAYRELGFIYQRQQRNDEAQKMFKQAADMNDATSAYQYAKTALNAKKSTTNEQEAVVYMMKAADVGNVQAQCELGTLYYQGKHVTKDATSAVKWFKKAAASGWTLAQWNLALCYIDGIGTTCDYDQALFWLGEATSKGYMQQFNKMCIDSEKGWKDKPFMTYMKAMSLYHDDKKNVNGAYNEFKKIKKTSVDARTMMAICLTDKDFKGYNIKKAVKELASLADKDNNKARFALASMNEKGEGIDRDSDRAKSLYQAAANAGYAVAQCYMGNLFFEGRIVEQNYVEAVRYYKMAEEQGQMDATTTTRYALCYEKGLGGLKVDTAKAQSLKKRSVKDNIAPMLKKVE